MRSSTLLSVLALAAVASLVGAASGGSSARTMAAAANTFLASLTPEQRAKAVFAFDDAQRLDWHFIPRPRKGLPLKEMDENQRKLAKKFLEAGLSQKGYLKANSIMELETILREIETAGGSRERFVRDPELYFFSVFGTPSAAEPWAWRVEGHHVALNFTVVKGAMVANTPSFFGSNPAEVRQGPQKGLRILAGEEDKGRELVRSLDEGQRKVALIQDQAFPDIITMNTKRVDPLAPVGIAASQLNKHQNELLMDLLREYATAMPADLAQERLDKLKRAGIENIRFGWAGGIERGQPHYYRVQGPTFLIEYDCTQNEANHIHSVWRDFNGDFGADLLQEHYRTSQHKS